MALTNGMNIIGLLSTPEFTDRTMALRFPILVFDGGYSNYVVAYVRSLSGSAVEKPPQDNDIIRGRFLQLQDDLSKRAGAGLHSAALEGAGDTWQAPSVSFLLNGQITYWRATAAVPPSDPGSHSSSLWAQDSYPTQLAANLRELRLTFLWPLLPNGSTGNGRQTFRTSVGGQLVTTSVSALPTPNALYFFQPGSFATAP